MLTVIGKATSINVRKVLWTCAALGLEVRREEWREEHAALNPNRMVPVLVNGELAVDGGRLTGTANGRALPHTPRQGLCQ